MGTSLPGALGRVTLFLANVQKEAYPHGTDAQRSGARMDIWNHLLRSLTASNSEGLNLFQAGQQFSATFT